MSKIQTLLQLLKNLSLLPEIARRQTEVLGAIEGISGRSIVPVAKGAPSAITPINDVLSFDYEYRPERRPLATGFGSARLLQALKEGEGRYLEHLKGIAALRSELELIPQQQTEGNLFDPFWQNGWFEALDGASLYYFLVRNNPAIYLEVGSGNSTKFARLAVQRHQLRTKIISIDPHPRAEIDELCDEVVRMPCEHAPAALFTALGAGDIMLVDNSHRSFPGSDVTVFFTELMPGLARGVTVGIHDIFLPNDYPESWMGRFYNEQYLLLAFILGGLDGSTIELPVAYLAEAGMIGSDLPDIASGGGGLFWMTR